MSVPDIIDSCSPREAIVKGLVDRIESGDLMPGDKLLATSRLAKHYGVATKTAQSAVAELARRGYLTRQAGRGTFVTPLRAGGDAESTATVGLVLTCTGHVWSDFVANLVRGLSDLSVKTVIADPSRLPDDRHESYSAARDMQALVRAKPRVVIVQYTHQVAFLRPLLPHTHFLCLESPSGYDLICDRVTPDYYRVGQLAGDAILAAGYRRPAALVIETKRGDTTPWAARPDDERILTGLRDTLAVGGLELATVLRAHSRDPDLGSMLPDFDDPATRPDVVFSTLTHRAMELLKLLRAKGLTVPDDLGMITGNNSPYAEALDLTAVDLRYSAIAALCLELVEARLKNPRPLDDRRLYMVQPALLQRHSLSPPPSP